MKRFTLLTILVLAVSFTWAQNTPITKSNYELPARFTPDKMKAMVFSTTVDPHFLKKSSRFWYMYETPAGKNWYIVNPTTASKQLLFDPAKVAMQVTEIVKDPYDAQHLPISNIRFNDKEDGFTFEITSSQDMTKAEQAAAEAEETILEKDDADKKDSKKPRKKIHYLAYDIASGMVSEIADYKRPKRNPQWASVSPDGQNVLFSRDNNLYWMSGADLEKAKKNEKDPSIVERQLTTDGVENFGWGYSGNVMNDEIEKNKGKRRPAWGIWSPDSKNFAISRSDSRKVGDLWVLHNTGSARPRLESYKYQMAGDTISPMEYLYVVNMETKQPSMVDIAAFKDQTIGVNTKLQQIKMRDDLNRPATEWLGSNSKFYITRTSRDMKRIDICEVDLATMKAKPVVEERLNTSLETRQIFPINGGKEFIEWSQRTGWAMFYLYNADGTLKNKITNGAFHCEEIVGVDEATRTMYFLANGVEPGENVYYTHLYRIGLDGSGMKRLNEQDFEHAIVMNDENKYFVDNYSRVNTTPVSALYDNTGRKIMDLEKADLSLLFETGYKFPEIFKFKAADGVTDMWGTMYKPFDFDSTRLYPIIEYVYPGPQTEANNTAFSARLDRTDRLAQFGFVVITLGNRGGHPSRSKWYHNYGYGNLRDYGLADKKTAVEQLANRHKWIDRTKVGIHGHSGGGFMSTAAVLVYPDFFKVAVSSAGNHENQIYNRWWSEKHHGIQEKVSDSGDTTFVYDIAKNSQVAKNLKGKLLLVTGDVDNNVHPANTLRVVDALIRSNKRFDMLVLPGQRHGFGDMTEYFFWRMGDYFSEHLIGDKEISVDIPQMGK